MLFGPFTIYALLAVAFLLSVPAASHTGLETWGSLAASSTAFAAMALNQFLAARPKFLEGAFGGLDRMYRTHKTLGKIAFALILVHYFVTPNFEGKLLTGGLNSFAKDAAEIGFYLLMGLIGISLFKKIPFTKLEIPYHLWRKSHRFIGVAFIFIAFHQMFIKRPFDGTALLAGYLNIFAALGILSFLFIQFSPFFRRKSYEIKTVTRQGGATHISAMPVGASLKTHPGQFAVISVKKSGLKEPHPFTIAGHKPDGEINFAIKALGDFTKRLYEDAEIGDKLQIEGGYGRFKYDAKKKRQLWLAGGIGVTPFLAMAETLKDDLANDICLVHCVRNAEEGISSDELKKQADKIGRFQYVLYCTDDKGRLDAQKLIDIVEFELDGADLMFCGPPPLRNAIVSALKPLGKKFSSQKFELFEFR